MFSRKSLFSGLLVVAVLFFTTGCAQRVAVQKTRTVSKISMIPNKKESSKETQDGITIKAKAIHPDNVDKYPALMTNVKYWYYKTDINGQRYVNSRGDYIIGRGQFVFSLVSYPAFEVKITNSTDHVLRFSNAVIAVEDDKGNSYEALTKDDLITYVKESINAYLGDPDKFYLARGEMNKLISKIRGLRLLDNNLKVLPGKTVKAFVVANYGHYTPTENKEYILETSKFTLGLYELPSKVNKAGRTVKTTRFYFVNDVKVDQKEETYTAYEYR